MRLAGFRIRTLMIVVAIAAVLSAIGAMVAAGRERAKWATVRVVNRRSTPLVNVRVIYPEGEHRVARVPSGSETTVPIRIEKEANVDLQIDGRPYASWYAVRGGSAPTLTLSD